VQAHGLQPLQVEFELTAEEQAAALRLKSRVELAGSSSPVVFWLVAVFLFVGLGFVAYVQLIADPWLFTSIAVVTVVVVIATSLRRARRSKPNPVGSARVRVEFIDAALVVSSGGSTVSLPWPALKQVMSDLGITCLWFKSTGLLISIPDRVLVSSQAATWLERIRSNQCEASAESPVGGASLSLEAAEGINFPMQPEWRQLQYRWREALQLNAYEPLTWLVMAIALGAVGYGIVSAVLERDRPMEITPLLVVFMSFPVLMVFAFIFGLGAYRWWNCGRSHCDFLIDSEALQLRQPTVNTQLPLRSLIVGRETQTLIWLRSKETNALVLVLPRRLIGPAEERFLRAIAHPPNAMK
jgi:hypothetical protein